MTDGQPEFPNYFDPEREAKAAQRDQAMAESGEQPEFEQYQPTAPAPERDGMIDVDEDGNPDPNDPDLQDVAAAFGFGSGPTVDDDDIQDPRPGEEPARGEQAYATPGAGPEQPGIRATGFPFPGIAGTTRSGLNFRVGGCCLPIPLFMLGLAGTVAGLALGVGRRR